MSKIDDLLQGVKVEWKQLGDVCNIFNGFAFDSKKFNNEGIGLTLIRIRDVNTGLSNTFYSGEYNEKFIVNNGDILIGMDGDFIAVKWCHDKALLNQRVCRLQEFKSNINPQFIFYIVQGELDRIHSEIEGSTVKHLSSRELSKSMIPIPTLKIQQEIVRILDQLTDTTNNLKTQLENERQIRKKQFEFYREELFTFEEGKAEWKTLGDITQIITKGTTPKIFSSNGINFIKIESFNNNKIIPNKFMFISKEIHEKELKRSILKSNDILFAIAGATIGKCAIVSEDILPANTNQALAIIRLNENINLKYIFNFLQSLEMKKYIEKFNKTSAQPNLNLKQISDFKIPIPSIEEQERIVNLLDQFDAAHTAIEEELTNEIKLRTQQYEYYREKLLTFPKN